jgi:hypothetical protein
MNPTIHLVRTVFVDHRTQEKSYGFRIYSDEIQSYASSMMEPDLYLSDEEFLKRCQEHFNDDAMKLVGDAIYTGGIYVDGNVIIP